MARNPWLVFEPPDGVNRADFTASALQTISAIRHLKPDDELHTEFEDGMIKVSRDDKSVAPQDYPATD